MVSLALLVKQNMKKVNKKNHIDGKVNKKELKSEIQELLFVHPQWDGNHKITNELVDEIMVLLHS